ncbi:putative storage protein LPV [Phytophthora cinnamomi]|uniref:putative storage protein LPV n=1 Tax=Phytophthora cinnamomi TaxID=4785 RepID=UPI00355A8A67|nr:putative storage protein LPV [Phytophthora cinnamomi]
MSVETSSGEQQLIVATSDGDSIQVPVVESLPELLHSDPNPYANPYANQEEPEQPVVLTVDVVNDDGDHEQVIVVGDVEDGKQTIEVANDQDDYTEKEVVAVETDQSESTVVPDGNGGTTVVNVPDVPDVIADLATDDTQVVNVVNPDNGAQQQIVIEDAPEHGEVTVDIVDKSGEVTTEDVTVVETDDGLKLDVPTDNGIVPVVVPDVPPDVQGEIAEEENSVPPVLQTVDVVTLSGEEKQEIVDGEPDHGVQTVEIPTDNGDYVETQVVGVETDDGVKLAIPDAQGETTVVTVPDVLAAVAQEASDDTLVLNVESPSGEMQQVIIVGKPENGLQTIQIVDQHGELVTEEVKATETSEVTQITVLTDGGYIPVTIPDVPKEAKEEIADQQAEAADADGDAVVAIVPEVVDEFAKMATMEALTKTTAKNLQSWVYENRQSLRRGNPFDQEEDASVMQTTDVANDFGGLR